MECPFARILMFTGGIALCVSWQHARIFYQNSFEGHFEKKNSVGCVLFNLNIILRVLRPMLVLIRLYKLCKLHFQGDHVPCLL